MRQSPFFLPVESLILGSSPGLYSWSAFGLSPCLGSTPCHQPSSSQTCLPAPLPLDMAELVDADPCGLSLLSTPLLTSGLHKCEGSMLRGCP